MTSEPTIEQVRKTQEAQLERLRKLQSDKRSATPDQQLRMQEEIDALDKDIRNLDTVIQSLLSKKR
jgi:membrane protein involved in colicin uptake